MSEDTSLEQSRLEILGWARKELQYAIDGLSEEVFEHWE